MVTPTTPGGRIRSARKAARLTQLELANETGTSQQIIYSYEKGKRGTKHPDLELLYKISKRLTVTIDWILTGEGPKGISEGVGGSILATTYPRATFTVPVIKWEDVATWINVGRENMNVANCETIPLFNTAIENSFGLRIKDDAMVATAPTNTFEQVKPGDIVIIDPNLKPAADDYVIVAINGNEPILRKLVAKGSDHILRALNQHYPDHNVTEAVSLYGVMVGLHRAFTR